MGAPEGWLGYSSNSDMLNANARIGCDYIHRLMPISFQYAHQLS